MKSFVGKYVCNNMDEGADATVIFSPQYLSIGYNNEQGLHQQTTWPYKQIQYRYDIANATTVVENMTIKQSLFFPDKNITKDLDEAVAYNNKPWIAKMIGRDGWKLLLVFLIFVAILFGLYWWLVPRLSDKLAQTMPIKTEVSMGQKIFTTLVDTNKALKHESAIVNEYFTALDITSDYKAKITVIKDETVNAFAIMGGNIVIYTGLLNKLQHHEELAALLGHEFTHINKRHTTRSLCRALGSQIFLSLLFGDMSGATSIIIDNANELGSLKYSRSLEEESDRDGLALLDERGISGEGFVQLFHHLKEAGGNGVSEILSSHPDIENRITTLKKDKHFTTNKKAAINDKLAAIFARLSTKEGSGVY